MSKYQDYLNEAEFIKVKYHDGRKARMRILTDNGKMVTVRDAVGKKMTFDKKTGETKNADAVMIIPKEAGKTPDSLLKSILPDID